MTGDFNADERGEWRKKMDEDITTVKQDLSEVKNAIIGNKQYRNKGLVERVEDVERWQLNVTMRIMFIAGVSAGSISGGIELVKFVIHK